MYELCKASGIYYLSRVEEIRFELELYIKHNFEHLSDPK